MLNYYQVDRLKKRRQQVCTHCGRGPHSQQVYLANDATCHKCNKKAQYAIQSQFQTFQKSLILSLIQ